MTIKNLSIAAAFIAATAFPLAAAADCPSDTSFNLDMVNGFLKNARVYDQQSSASGDVNDLLSQAEWDNAEHYFKMIDEATIDDCGDNAALAYYIFEMILDIHSTDAAIAAYKAASDDMKAVEGDSVTSALYSSALDASLFYEFYAKHAPKAYASFKRQIHAQFAEVGIAFTPWEQHKPTLPHFPKPKVEPVPAGTYELSVAGETVQSDQKQAVNICNGATAANDWARAEDYCLKAWGDYQTDYVFDSGVAQSADKVNQGHYELMWAVAQCKANHIFCDGLRATIDSVYYDFQAGLESPDPAVAAYANEEMEKLQTMKAALP
jgi:hypothetical protein